MRRRYGINLTSLRTIFAQALIVMQISSILIFEKNKKKNLDRKKITLK